MKTIITIGHLSLLFVIYMFSATLVDFRHTWLTFTMQISVLALTLVYIHFGKLKMLLWSMLVLLGLFIIGMAIETDIKRGLPYFLFLPLMFWLGKKAFNNKWWLLPAIILIPINSLLLFPNWFEFMKPLGNPDVHRVSVVDFELINEEQQPIQLPDKGYVILDFWTTTCPQCFRKFPEFEKLKKQYEHREDVKFYAINVPHPTRDTFQKTKELIDKWVNYDFEVLLAKDKEQIEQTLKFNKYPRIFIIKDGKVLDAKQSINPGHIIFNNVEYKLKSLLD